MEQITPENDVKLLVDLKAAFDGYGNAAAEFDQTVENPANQQLHALFGLAAEAGEVLGKFQKIIRDKGGVINNDDRLAVAKELGDVLWFVNAVARSIGVPFHVIPLLNIEKLADRRKRGAMAGSGDDR